MKKKSAILPYRKKASGIEVLLVRNFANSKWVIPKGTVEHPIPASLSAAQEAYEEAGVLGSTLPVQIGEYKKNEQWVATYLLKVDRVLDAYDESTIRERKWVNVINAHDYLVDSDLLEVVLTGAKVITKRSAFFKKLIKTFSKELDLKIVTLTGASAVVEFLPAIDHTHSVTINRYKKRLEFYISSDTAFKSMSEIDTNVVIDKLLDNCEGEDGFWGMQKTEDGYELGRLLSFPMKLLNSTNFALIIKSLVSGCHCFPKKTPGSPLVELDLLP